MSEQTISKTRALKDSFSAAHLHQLRERSAQGDSIANKKLERHDRMQAFKRALHASGGSLKSMSEEVEKAYKALRIKQAELFIEKCKHLQTIRGILGDELKRIQQPGAANVNSLAENVRRHKEKLWQANTELEAALQGAIHCQENIYHLAPEEAKHKQKLAELELKTAKTMMHRFKHVSDYGQALGIVETAYMRSIEEHDRKICLYIGLASKIFRSQNNISSLMLSYSSFLANLALERRTH